MNKKRTRLEIIIEILETIYNEEEVNPTRLALLVNMSYDRLKRILEELESKGLVEILASGERSSTMTVKLTKKGVLITHELRRIRNILRDYGLLE